MILAIAIGFVGWIRPGNLQPVVGVGCLWLVLMLAIEIDFGRFVMRYFWERIGSDDNLLRGGLLPLGMLVLMVAPLLATKVRRLP